jgi:uncharacterized protein
MIRHQEQPVHRISEPPNVALICAVRMVNYVLVLALGAGSLSGIIGTGASIILLPVLVFQFGPKQAVPIMAIAALMSNVAKVMAW